MEAKKQTQLSSAEIDSQKRIQLIRDQVVKAEADAEAVRQNASGMIEAELAKFPNLRALESEAEQGIVAELEERHNALFDWLQESFENSKPVMEMMADIFREANPNSDLTSMKDGENFYNQFWCYEGSYLSHGRDESLYSEDEWLNFKNLILSKGYSVEYLIDNYMAFNLGVEMSSNADRYSVWDYCGELEDFSDMVEWFEDL